MIIVGHGLVSGLALHRNGWQTHPVIFRSRNCGHIGDCLQGVFQDQPLSPCHPIDYCGRQVAVWLGNPLEVQQIACFSFQLPLLI